MHKALYLQRIGYSGELAPTIAVLSGLQEAHLLTVPFENLDIRAGRKIVLDPTHLFEKIVTMRRGGFCYELNSLFFHLLRELGFRPKIVSGRVFDRKRNAYGREFDHMLNMVTIDNRMWLVDVGFGDFSMLPLYFQLNEPLRDKSGRFIIEGDNGGCFRVSRFSEEEKRYLPQYIFSLQERRIEDFTEMCLYHQTSPASHFTQQRVCSIATATGRITLTDDKLIVTENNRRVESRITNEEEFRRALVEYFNIHTPL